jgi:hypothetical protein
MALQVIRGGSPVDIPSLAEIRSIEEERERQFARGIKWMRTAVSDPASPTKETIPGPDQGYSWKLRRFTATLTAADSVTVYTGTEAASNRLIAFTPLVTGQTVYVISFAPEEIIKGGESIFVTTAGTGHFSSYYLSAWQAPAEMEWKFL